MKRFVLLPLLLTACTPFQGSPADYATPIVIQGTTSDAVTGYVIQQTPQALYVGDMVNGKPHGHGTLYLKDRQVITGHWADGKLEGQAVVFSTALDAVSVGKYSNGLQQGEGYVSVGNQHFLGNIVNGTPAGRGTCFQDNQATPCEIQQP